MEKSVRWWGAASDVGKVREENEDSFVVEAEVGLFLVADGMGGHRGGALASKIVAEDLPVMIETRLAKLRGHSVRAIRAMLKRTIVEQNRQLQMEGTSEAGYKGMGATVVVTLLRDGRTQGRVAGFEDCGGRFAGADRDAARKAKRTERQGDPLDAEANYRRAKPTTPNGRYKRGRI